MTSKVEFQPIMKFVVDGGLEQLVGMLYANDAPKDPEDNSSLGYAAIVSCETERVVTVHKQWASLQMTQYILRYYNLVGAPRFYSRLPLMSVDYDPDDVVILTGNP